MYGSYLKSQHMRLIKNSKSEKVPSGPKAKMHQSDTHF